VPDTFKDGAEVVLKGRLGPDGFDVEANGVMAKCPSKYDASPNAPVKAPEHAKPAVTAS
jgi:cytochrome c-type biogenesis protein CcmE